MMCPNRFARAAATIMLAASPLSTSAETKSWDAVVGSWNQPSNWSPTGVPDGDDEVFIGVSPDSATRVFLSAPATADSITVQAGADLEIDVFDLTVHGQLQILGSLGPDEARLFAGFGPSVVSTGSTTVVDAMVIMEGGELITDLYTSGLHALTTGIGTIRLRDGGHFQVNETSTLEALSGELLITGNIDSSFTSAGAISVPSGFGLLRLQVPAITLAGSVTVGSTLSISLCPAPVLTETGTLVLADGGVLQGGDAWLDVAGNLQVTGSGPSSAAIETAVLESSGLIVIDNDQTLELLTSLAIIDGGVVTGPGTLHVTGAELRLDGGSLIDVHTLSMSDVGTVHIAGDTTIASPAFEPGGDREFFGDARVAPAATLTVTGNPWVIGGFPAPISGSLLVEGQVTGAQLFNEGELGGTGSTSTASQLVNKGDLGGGLEVTHDGLASYEDTGTLLIDGDFFQTFQGRLHIQANAHAVDRVVVTGAATLGGELIVQPQAGWQPEAGHHLIFSADSIAGAFDTITIPDEYELEIIGNKYYINTPFVYPWLDDFDLFPPDTPLPGQGGWRPWLGGPQFAEFHPIMEYSFSGGQSLEIDGLDHAVQPFEHINDGRWTWRTMMYMPCNFDGFPIVSLYSAYMPEHQNIDPAVQIMFDPFGGSLFDLATQASAPLITDEWVELRMEIDFDADLVELWYDGQLVETRPWTAGSQAPNGGILNLAALSLAAGGSNVAMYFDDIGVSAFQPTQCPADTNGDGAIDVDDLVNVILDFGAGPNNPPQHGGDVTGDGIVNVDDLILVIVTWNQC